jgi:hypothetical protein
MSAENDLGDEVELLRNEIGILRQHVEVLHQTIESFRELFEYAINNKLIVAAPIPVDSQHAIPTSANKDESTSAVDSSNLTDESCDTSQGNLF